MENADFPKFPNLSQGHPEAPWKSPGASGRPFWSSRIAFRGVPRNTGFSPTGPSPGASGGVSGSLVLTSRAAWVFFFFLDMVRSTLPPFRSFSRPRVGQVCGFGPWICPLLKTADVDTKSLTRLKLRKTCASRTCAHLLDCRDTLI